MFCFLSVTVKASYFETTVKNKDLVIWLNENRLTSRDTPMTQSEWDYGLMTDKKNGDIYKLRMLTKQGRNFKFEVLDNAEKKVAVINMDLKKNEGQWLDQVSGLSSEKMPKSRKKQQSVRSSKLEHFKMNVTPELAKQIKLLTKKYSNKKCDFLYVDQSNLSDKLFFKRLVSINQKILESFSEWGCELDEKMIAVKEVEAVGNEADVKQSIRNQLSCDTQALVFNNRFLATNVKCIGQLSNESKLEVQTSEKNFYEIYDSHLKLVVKKADITDSDLIDEDDSQMIEFGLDPVGLFIYYAEPKADKISYKKQISFYHLKKKFEQIGQSKPYLRNFEIK